MPNKEKLVPKAEERKYNPNSETSAERARGTSLLNEEMLLPKAEERDRADEVSLHGSDRLLRNVARGDKA